MICEAIAKRIPPIMMGFTTPEQEFFILLPSITPCPQGIIIYSRRVVKMNDRMMKITQMGVNEISFQVANLPVSVGTIRMK